MSNSSAQNAGGQAKDDSLNTSAKDDSIINRKLGLGVPLPNGSPPHAGHRSSPATSSRRGPVPPDNPNRSVKAIVAWLESSSAETQSSTLCELTISSSRSRVLAAAPCSPDPLHIDTTGPVIAKAAPDVEQYSNVREYFAEPKLEICLDQPDDASKIGGVGSLEEPEKLRGSHSVTQSKTAAVKMVQQSDEGTSSLRERKPVLSGKLNEEESPQKACNVPHRHAKQAKAFWNDVRCYLWISDREMEVYSAQIEGERAVRNLLNSYTEEPCSIHYEHQWCYGSSSSTRTGSSTRSQQRHKRAGHAAGSDPTFIKSHRRERLLSLEEKMSEINYFLDEKNDHRETDKSICVTPPGQMTPESQERDVIQYKPRAVSKRSPYRPTARSGYAEGVDDCVPELDSKSKPMARTRATAHRHGRIRLRGPLPPMLFSRSAQEARQLKVSGQQGREGTAGGWI